MLRPPSRPTQGPCFRSTADTALMCYRQVLINPGRQSSSDLGNLHVWSAPRESATASSPVRPCPSGRGHVPVTCDPTLPNSPRLHMSTAERPEGGDPGTP